MVEEEWSRLKEAILEVTEEVCVTRRMKKEKRKTGSAWSNEEIERRFEIRRSAS